MQNIFVYGSLRPGMYNANHIKSLNHISSHVVHGYDLYSLGSYPGILQGSRSLVVDLIEVSQEDYEGIHRMEIGAGYAEVDITIDGVQGKLYPYMGFTNPNNLIKNGDWVDFITKKQNL